MTVAALAAPGNVYLVAAAALASVVVVVVPLLASAQLLIEKLNWLKHLALMTTIEKCLRKQS